MSVSTKNLIKVQISKNHHSIPKSWSFKLSKRSLKKRNSKSQSPCITKRNLVTFSFKDQDSISNMMKTKTKSSKMISLWSSRILKTLPTSRTWWTIKLDKIISIKTLILSKLVLRKSNLLQGWALNSQMLKSLILQAINRSLTLTTICLMATAQRWLRSAFTASPKECVFRVAKNWPPKLILEKGLTNYSLIKHQQPTQPKMVLSLALEITSGLKKLKLLLRKRWMMWIWAQGWYA